jgi:hypothetical protein
MIKNVVTRMLFQKHEIITKHGLLMAILKINRKAFSEEFSLEQDNFTYANTHIREAALHHLQKHYPHLNIKVVRIMVGKVPFVTFHVPS